MEDILTLYGRMFKGHPSQNREHLKKKLKEPRDKNRGFFKKINQRSHRPKIVVFCESIDGDFRKNLKILLFIKNLLSHLLTINKSCWTSWAKLERTCF